MIFIVLYTHQIGTHEIIKSMLLNPLLLDAWECTPGSTTKVLGDQNTTDGKVLDFIFNGDWEDFQSNP